MRVSSKNLAPYRIVGVFQEYGHYDQCFLVGNTENRWIGPTKVWDPDAQEWVASREDKTEG